MLYILDQRLRAQDVSQSKAQQGLLADIAKNVIHK